MKKENLPVIIAIALPVLLILAVAAFAYLPNAGAKPGYNFLYVQNMWPYAYSYQGSECTIYKNYYEIENNHLSRKPFASATSTPMNMDVNSSAYGRFPVEKVLSPDPASYCSGYSRVVRKDAPDVYIYEAATDSARLIPYDEASKLTLVDGVFSPDGYTVGSSYSSSGFLEIFGGDNNYGIYAMKKNYKVKISIPQSENYGYGNFGFLAWVGK